MTNSRTIGYQEKNPKHKTAPMRYAWPVSASVTRRRRVRRDRAVAVVRGRGAGVVGRTVVAVIAGSWTGAGAGGPTPARVRSLTLGQHGVDLRLGRLQQVCDVGVRL